MQPVSLLCGLLCDETIWADIPSRLASVANTRVMSFAGFTSIAGMAGQVLAAAPARFAVAGHSMGGRVALEVWRQAPERVTALALLNTGVHPPRESEFESRGLLVRLARRHGMAALADEWLPPMMGAPPDRVAQVMPALKAMVQRSTVESFAGQINALLQRPDARPVLTSITVPTLLLSGTNDTWSSLSQHADIQPTVPPPPLLDTPPPAHIP